MATQSLSNAIPPVRDIERELRYAKSKLSDTIWEENEEVQAALKRQILRLEILRELGERYDVDH
jgi:hypothetical protein